MRYTIIICFGFLKVVDYNNKKWQYSFWYQWTKSSTLTSFLLSQLHYNIYGNNMYFDSRYAFGVFFHYSLFTCIVFIASSAASCQCWPLFHTTATLPNPADKFKAFFCTSVVSRTVIYRVLLWTIFSQT